MATAPNFRKFNRSTQEQLQFYINFCQRYPEFKCGKNSPKQAFRSQYLWRKLTKGLNELKGPTRNVDKWRETMRNWKNQLKTRARRIEMQGTQKPLTYFEEKALSTFALVDLNVSTNSTQMNSSNPIAVSPTSPDSSEPASIAPSPTSSVSSDAASVASSSPSSPATTVPESNASSVPGSPVLSMRDSPASSAPNSPVPSYSFSSFSQKLEVPTLRSATPEQKKPIKVEEMYAVILENIKKRDKRAQKREKARANRDQQLLSILQSIATSLSELVEKVIK